MKRVKHLALHFARRRAHRKGDAQLVEQIDVVLANADALALFDASVREETGGGGGLLKDILRWIVDNPQEFKDLISWIIGLFA